MCVRFFVGVYFGALPCSIFWCLMFEQFPAGSFSKWCTPKLPVAFLLEDTRSKTTFDEKWLADSTSLNA